MLDVNLIAPFVLVSEAEAGAAQVGRRRAAGLRSSTSAPMPACGPRAPSIPYAAAKAALHHVTRLLALALGPAIRVNCVAPGLVETPMTASWPEATELWNTRSPMRRPAKPEDIADLVAALGRQRLRYRRDRHRRWWAEPHLAT